MKIAKILVISVFVALYMYMLDYRLDEVQAERCAVWHVKACDATGEVK